VAWCSARHRWSPSPTRSRHRSTVEETRTTTNLGWTRQVILKFSTQPSRRNCHRESLRQADVCVRTVERWRERVGEGDQRAGRTPSHEMPSLRRSALGCWRSPTPPNFATSRRSRCPPARGQKPVCGSESSILPHSSGGRATAHRERSRPSSPRPASVTPPTAGRSVLMGYYVPACRDRAPSISLFVRRYLEPKDRWLHGRRGAERRARGGDLQGLVRGQMASTQGRSYFIRTTAIR